MPGMGASAGPAGFPALAVVLALFMLGYIVWTTDRLTIPGTSQDHRGEPGHHPQSPA